MGLDAVLFKDKLNIELNYYNHINDGILTRIENSLPLSTGLSSAERWENYNKIQYSGIESSLTYMDKLGRLGYSFNVSINYNKSKIKKFDEPDYRFDYQSRIGRPADGYWGLMYQGKFKSYEETLETPQLFDESLDAGDLKYIDMNNDGYIDDNDRVLIGHTSPKLLYYLNLNLFYRNFDLRILADGVGNVDLPLTSTYFQNGWADNNYSRFVQENLGSAYPKLSYYRIDNNFQRSDFWLTDGSYLKIKNIELGYNLPSKTAKSLYINGLRLFARGSNLWTMTKVRYIDPESPNSGVTMYPLFTTFTGGMKITF